MSVPVTEHAGDSVGKSTASARGRGWKRVGSKSACRQACC